MPTHASLLGGDAAEDGGSALRSSRLAAVALVAPEAPDLEHLMDVHLDVSIASMIPNGPAGTRVTVQVENGTFAGPRLRGTVVGPGGDWAVVRADGSLKLDVRVLLRTDDGADVYMTYSGIGLDGGARLRTAPQFETGDERYAWLNAVQAVSTGSSDGKIVDYQVFALA